MSVDELSDDDNVFIAAAMGAPTVMIEKLFSIEDQHRAVETLERFLARQASAIISAEIGGCNSMIPVAYAARKSVGEGKRVAGRLDIGGRRDIKKKKKLNK